MPFALSYVLLTVAAAQYVDPLDAPAAASQRPSGEPVLAITNAGNRLVAVGMRGLIVFSDDNGNHWAQAEVPAQSDLTGVRFISALRGWAVGHDGLVLTTSDGAKTWIRQIDGRIAAKTFPSYYQNKIDQGAVELLPYLEQVSINFKEQAMLPYFDIQFDTAQTGYIVGAFGTIAGTDDGGKTWQPWLERIENPDFLNLNSINLIGKDIYIAGERGMVYRLDRAKKMFMRLSTGYSGSFFGIIGDARALVAFGLRGAIYRSIDQGATWHHIPNSLAATIMSGAVLPSGTLILANVAGNILVSQDHGASFQATPANLGIPLTGVLSANDGKLIASTLLGIRAVPLGKP